MNERLQQIEDGDIAALEAALTPALAAQRTLEDASQAMARQLYESFRRDAVLVRIYATVPFGQLPKRLGAIVSRLATRHGRVPVPSTPVLSLFGTFGVEAAWRDRRSSVDHAAIPLFDARFVDGAPMIARLLKELGVDLKGLEADLEGHARRMAGGFNGLFYVADATVSLDSQGRHVIPAQDFVAHYGVKTVFGMGGQFLTGPFAACIVFCRSYVPRLQAARFARLISTLKVSTSNLVRDRLLFHPE